MSSTFVLALVLAALLGSAVALQRLSYAVRGYGTAPWASRLRRLTHRTLYVSQADHAVALWCFETDPPPREFTIPDGLDNLALVETIARTLAPEVRRVWASKLVRRVLFLHALDLRVDEWGQAERDALAALKRAWSVHELYLIPATEEVGLVTAANASRVLWGLPLTIQRLNESER